MLVLLVLALTLWLLSHPRPEPTDSTPVTVVDDPTDPWAVASVITGILVGVISAFLAWRAVRIGQGANALAAKAAAEAEEANRAASKARRAVAVERRRTFELEVLRDLLELADPEDFARTVVGAPGILHEHSGRLALIPDEDLKFWRKVAESDRQGILDLLNARPTEDDANLVYAEVYGIYHPSAAAIKRTRTALLDDLTEAIERRVHAFDD